MRRFTTACRDSVTGYEMILSECSYNQACDWLSRELIKQDYEILEVETSILDGLVVITTAKNVLDFSKEAFLDFSNILGARGRTFFYDEKRGYLLGE